jgi:HPt (histidine-containing phosphotransfer) domain-containing protein
LDRKKLLAECDDEQAFANRCLHVFVRETQADMKGIAAALEHNDFPGIVRRAHRIKGASSSIRAEFLKQQAAYLEILGNEEDLVAVRECYARLKVEFKHFKSFVNQLHSVTDS